MNNKKLFPILGLAAAMGAASLTSCSEEQTLPVGEGTMFLSARVNSDVKVESRAANEEELAASTIVWISNSEGVVRKYNGLSELPPSGVKLLSGDYTVKAWAGKLEYASFTSRWFEGEQAVTLSAGDKKAVEVECRIANVVASVLYADNIDEVISDYTLTVSHKGGSLTFEGRDERKGYFMMPEGVTTLDYVLTATSEGREITSRGTIENVEPAHEYVLNVKATSPAEDASGSAFITIEVDDTMIEVADDVVITTAPAIVGYGFDLTSPVAGEAGTIGRKSVYVCSATELANLKLSGVPGIADLDLITATADVIAEVRARGVFAEVQNVDGGQLTKVVFEDSFINALPNSDEPYVITLSATDGGGKTTTASLTLRISLAPVVTNPAAAEDVTYTSAVLSAQVMKDVESVGFQYRPVGAAEWSYIAGSASRAAFTKGQVYYATLTNLPFGAAYEFRAVSGTAENPAEYQADALSFATLTPPQLPNGNMSDWVKSGKVILPAPSADNQFWDSGNHGSATMDKNITNSFDINGNTAAELKSMFVGVGTLGKFAAGNIFVGKYLKTEKTDGLLGFGREFDFPQGLKVTAVRLRARYVPGTVEKGGKGDHLAVGDKDQGEIYVAIFDDYDNSEKGYENAYGCIVRTKKSGRKLFDKNAANVVAYGNHVFTSDTGSDLVDIEIPLEYYSGKGAPKLISVVCSASRYGDYFEGGEGSLLYVDDFELVYEAL